MSAPRARRALIPGALVVGSVIAVGLVACQAGPIDAFPTAVRPTAVPTSDAPAATPVPSAPSRPLPSSCETLFSDALTARIQSALGPMNADGFELVSTQNGDALDVLASAPTLRCTWGTPGQDGLSTNVTAVDTAQTTLLLTAFRGAGYACSDVDGGTLCSFEQKTVTLDDRIVTRGEDQFVRGDRWIATAWVGHLPDHYTPDVAAAAS